MSKTLAVLLAATFFLTLAPIAFGAEPVGDSSEQHEVLEEEATEIVVTASRGPEPANEAAAALSRLQREEIDRRGPQEAVELLGTLPGVTAQDMGPGGFGANLSIRGSSDFKPGGFGNRVLVLLDGFPLNIPDTDGLDWNGLPLYDIERLEVLRGPASALYGSTALGGVVQLISSPIAPSRRLSWGQGFQDWRGNRSRLRVGWSEGDGDAGLSLYSSWQKYAGLTPGEEDKPRYNSESETFGVRGRGELEVGGGQRLQVSALLSGGRGGNPGFEGTSEHSRSRHFDRFFSQAGLRWNLAAGSGFKAESSIFWNHFSQTVADPDGSSPNHYLSHRLGWRAQLSLPAWGRTLHTAGLELGLDRVGGTVFQLGRPDEERVYHSLAGAAYWQGQLELGRGLELRGGLRLDGHRFDTGQQFFSLSPKISLAWRPQRSSVLWVALNRGFRVPTIGEMYLNYLTSFGLMLQGNPELGPESVWAAEAGARQSFLRDRLGVELCLFYNRGWDTIEFVYSSPVSSRNLEGSRVLGLEFSLRARPTRPLDVGLSLSALDAVSLPDGEQLLYRPAAQATLDAVLNLGDLEFSAFLQAVTSRLYDDFLDAASAVVDPQSGLLRFPRRRLEAYFLLNLSASWRSGPLKVSFFLNNAFDRRIYIIQGYPAPGREWYLEVLYDW